MADVNANREIIVKNEEIRSNLSLTHRIPGQEAACGGVGHIDQRAKKKKIMTLYGKGKHATNNTISSE